VGRFKRGSAFATGMDGVIAPEKKACKASPSTLKRPVSAKKRKRKGRYVLIDAGRGKFVLVHERSPSVQNERNADTRCYIERRRTGTERRWEDFGSRKRESLNR